jgi:uncharacterized Zn-finger protein
VNYLSVGKLSPALIGMGRCVSLRSASAIIIDDRSIPMFPIPRRFSQRLIGLNFASVQLSPKSIGTTTSAFSAVVPIRASSMSSTSSSEPGRHVCEYCSRSFKYPSMLAQHLTTHTGAKQFSCTFCKKSFTRAYTLKIHLRHHQGQTPYACQYCPKQYVEVGKLNMHVKRVHNGVKPWTCSSCPKRFPCQSQWQVHQRVHTGERPFNCPSCWKCFSVNSSLQRHQLTHLQTAFAPAS